MEIDTGLFGPQDAFEVLIGDCMRTEPHPGEIQVLGYARGWRAKLDRMAARRGLRVTVTVEPA
jgi:hypothetical protein